jgi:hypothetical protein
MGSNIHKIPSHNQNAVFSAASCTMSKRDVKGMSVFMPRQAADNGLRECPADRTGECSTLE